MTHVSSEDSDLTVHPPSLIWVYTFSVKKEVPWAFSLWAQQNAWYDLVDAHGDQSLCWICWANAAFWVSLMAHDHTSQYTMYKYSMYGLLFKVQICVLQIWTLNRSCQTFNSDIVREGMVSSDAQQSLWPDWVGTLPDLSSLLSAKINLVVLQNTGE